jgi:hypothetical protein
MPIAVGPKQLQLHERACASCLSTTLTG